MRLTLTGSERISKSEATGDRLKEAQHINKSLSALGDVMAALGAKKPHIPYRNSKLTTVLQDSLGASRSHRVGSAPTGCRSGPLVPMLSRRRQHTMVNCDNSDVRCSWHRPLSWLSLQVAMRRCSCLLL